MSEFNSQRYYYHHSVKIQTPLYLSNIHVEKSTKLHKTIICLLCYFPSTKILNVTYSLEDINVIFIGYLHLIFCISFQFLSNKKILIKFTIHSFTLQLSFYKFSSWGETLTNWHMKMAFFSLFPITCCMDIRIHIIYKFKNMTLHLSFLHPKYNRKNMTITSLWETGCKIQF